LRNVVRAVGNKYLLLISDRVNFVFSVCVGAWFTFCRMRALRVTCLI